jgi:hypothetical protein
MKTADLLNSIFIIIVFIALYVANILAIGKKNIENNWALYRCSPLVMPFANLFGHDTMENFAYCIQNMQTDFMGPLLTPTNYSNAISAAGISSAVDNHTNSMGMLSNVRGFFSTNFSSLFNVFGNIALLMNIMAIKIRDMVGKLGGVYYTMMNILQGTSDTMQSTWNALPGKLLQALPHK